MRRRLRNAFIASFMSALMLMSVFILGQPPTVFAAIPDPVNGFSNPCGYNPSVDGPIPSDVRPCSDTGYKFNSEYYQKWQYIVYGGPDDVGSRQIYKKGWQTNPNDPSTVDLTKGHFYVWDAKYGGYTYGEYKFLGYTQDGSLYTNMYYINDDDSSASNGNRHWVIQPWANLPSSYISRNGPQSPGYVYQNPFGDYDDPMDPRFAYLVPNMKRSLNFEITKGVDYADRYTVLPYTTSNIDPRNYMAVNQAPTSREAGYGTMYHFSWVSNKLWYQTFPLAQFEPEEKSPTPAECTTQVLDSQPVAIGKGRNVKVRIAVTGTLQDTAYYGNYQNETKYYTRKDVTRWRLDLWDDTQSAYQHLYTDNPVDKVVEKDNTATGTFDLTINTDKVDKSDPNQWKYTTNAAGFVFYGNNKDWKPSYSNAYCNLSVTFKPVTQTMKSQFNVIPYIEFEQKSQFASSNVAYIDESFGQDVDYYQFEITNTEDDTKITKTVDPAIPEVQAPDPGYLDQAAINSWLYNFMLSKFPNDTVTTKRERNFIIKQTIVDRDSSVNNTSVYSQTVTIAQQPPGGSSQWSPSPGGCYGAVGNGNSVDLTSPPPPQYIQPDTEFPRDWYDVAPFPVKDNPPVGDIPHAYCDAPPGYDQFTKTVTVDGSSIDAATFFAGKYAFGTSKTGLHQVKVVYTAPDGTQSFMSQGVVIHESMPRVSIAFSGPWKQNRTMTATDTSAFSNDKWVQEHSPLQITSFSYVNTSDPSLKTRAGYAESNLSQKIYMYKAPGHYQMSIAASRTLKDMDGTVLQDNNGQPFVLYSDPYVVQYEILPDEKPAIIAHPYSSQVSRLDAIKLHYDVVSIDGDFIANKMLTVYYDSKNDGTFDQQVFQSTGDLTELPVFNKLGQYKFEVIATEGTDQDRLMEYITPADDQTNSFTGYFFVDNYEPSSDLYLDVPNQKPDMDVFFMLDANLTQSETDYVNGNKVTITNAFTTQNMLANIGTWDMKTYTYSQSASTSVNTGTSYPPSTYYYTSNGYAGTLNRTSVSNSPYTVDQGSYVTQTDSKTATSSCTHTQSGTYGSSGTWSLTYDSGSCPSSKSYNDGQYSGTLYRTGDSGTSCSYTGTPGTSCTSTWTAYYSGTVYYTHQVWKPNLVTYNNYTGYYSGIIYKDVRQPYDVSFLRAIPTKYFVYISDNTVSQLSDLQTAMSQNNAKLICVGQSAMTSQISCDKFIPNGSPIDQVIGDVINYIAQSNPAIPKVYKLVGESFDTHTATFDFEKDPLTNDQLQVIQDPYYFDNSTGFDTFGGKTLTSTESGSNWTAYQTTLTFNKPGKYVLYRRVQDQPSSDPNFTSYSYYSNESAVEVYVHRKPIADVTLDYDYDINSGTYRTTWVDKSYDLDHNVTRASTDRGIQARTIKFTNTGTGQVFTAIPSSLSPGTYRLDYAAQDLEGVWSDPVTKTFVLPSTVPVQMASNLKTTDSTFSLSSVPASEQLTAYGLWTRYPYSIYLTLQMTLTGNYINRTVPYYTGTKNGNDINWNDEVLTIPTTTPDGTYMLRIQGIGSVKGSSAYQDYFVNVVTPINLSGRIDNSATTDISTLVVNDPYTIKAWTTKYANSVTVTLFKGTAYQKSFTMTSTTTSTTGYGQNAWTVNYTIGAMPDGTYTVEWKGTTPNGNTQTVTKTVQVTNNRPPVSSFTCTPNPAYEGDVISCMNTSTDPDGDAMTYIWTVSGPNEYSATFTTTNISLPRSVTENRAGTYSITLRATDSKGRANDTDAQKNVVVQALTIFGQVNHTAQWEQNRLNWNASNPSAQRAMNTFWAGEGFDLIGTPTNTSNSGGSTTAASSIFVMATGIGNASLTQQSAPTWTGYIGQDTTATNLENLADGPYNFTFTVTYSNGVQKSTTAIIYISGNWNDYFRFHQKY